MKWLTDMLVSLHSLKSDNECGSEECSSSKLLSVPAEVQCARLGHIVIDKGQQDSHDHGGFLPGVTR